MEKNFILSPWNNCSGSCRKVLNCLSTSSLPEAKTSSLYCSSYITCCMPLPILVAPVDSFQFINIHLEQGAQSWTPYSRCCLTLATWKKTTSPAGSTLPGCSYFFLHLRLRCSGGTYSAVTPRSFPPGLMLNQLVPRWRLMKGIILSQVQTFALLVVEPILCWSNP